MYGSQSTGLLQIGCGREKGLFHLSLLVEDMDLPGFRYIWKRRSLKTTQCPDRALVGASPEIGSKIDLVVPQAPNQAACITNSPELLI
jgi:hypothetical protein